MFSKLVRRTHMYLALFLAPWMIGYALSTIAMKHRMPRPTIFVTETRTALPERVRARHAPTGNRAADSFGPQSRRRVRRAGTGADGRLTINRQGMLSPRRITFTPQNRRIVVERMELETSGFLNRFHRRRGYQQPYAADLAMAISVDAVIVAMVFWALSGLWMWWEMRATRLVGACVRCHGHGHLRSSLC